MKRILMLLSLSALLFITGFEKGQAQEEPKPKKDTVNMDTHAKPTFYYAVEDEKANEAAKKGGSGATIAIVCGVVVVVIGTGFFLLKKKKK
jgi:hypothetical protein